MSVEQSRGPSGPGIVGFGGSEEEPDPATDGLAPPSPTLDEDEDAALEDAAAEVVAEPEAVCAAAEDFEPPHPAVSATTASEAASATPSRMPLGLLESEVFISSSMPCAAARARANLTMKGAQVPAKAGVAVPARYYRTASPDAA